MKYLGMYKEMLYKAIRKKGDNKNKEESENKERVEVEKQEGVENNLEETEKLGGVENREEMENREELDDKVQMELTLHIPSLGNPGLLGHPGLQDLKDPNMCLVRKRAPGLNGQREARGSRKIKYRGTYKELLETMTKGIIKNTMDEDGDFKEKGVIQIYKAIRKKGDSMEKEDNKEKGDNKEEAENKGEMESEEDMEK